MSGDRQPSRRVRPTLRRAFAVVLGAALVAGCGDGSSGRTYVADLDQLNRSGVKGEAKLEAEDGRIEVSIDASGLAKNRIHEQHVHAVGDGRAHCPPGGGGLLRGAGAEGVYGSTLLDLEPYPTVADDGRVAYRHTLEAAEPELNRLPGAAIVLFGATRNGRFLPDVPVACGILEP